MLQVKLSLRMGADSAEELSGLTKDVGPPDINDHCVQTICKQSSLDLL